MPKSDASESSTVGSDHAFKGLSSIEIPVDIGDGVSASPSESEERAPISISMDTINTAATILLGPEERGGQD